MIIAIAIIFMIISFLVSSKLKSKFRKYSQTTLMSNMSGAEVAQSMLRDNGLYDIRVTCQPGHLTDHYNPRDRTVNLSESVYYGRNAAAAAVAAHECGHAVQHAKAYRPLEFRTMLVPIQSVSARVLNIIVLIAIFGGGFFYNFGWNNIILAVIACYFILTLFSFVTLPVEFDASKRALVWIKSKNIASADDQYMAKDALKWAAMTYVVAAIGSLVTLLYFVMILLGNRD